MCSSSERSFPNFDEADKAVFSGMNSEVAAHIRALAGDFCRAGLANEYCACMDSLPAKSLDA